MRAELRHASQIENLMRPDPSGRNWQPDQIRTRDQAEREAWTIRLFLKEPCRNSKDGIDVLRERINRIPECFADIRNPLLVALDNHPITPTK